MAIGEASSVFKKEAKMLKEKGQNKKGIIGINEKKDLHFKEKVGVAVPLKTKEKDIKIN